eukprot:1400923-Amphidinium_carterae.3
MAGSSFIVPWCDVVSWGSVEASSVRSGSSSLGKRIRLGFDCWWTQGVQTCSTEDRLQFCSGQLRQHVPLISQNCIPVELTLERSEWYPGQCMEVVSILQRRPLTCEMGFIRCATSFLVHGSELGRDSKLNSWGSHGALMILPAATSTQLGPEEKVYPVIEALAMGWSWALWFCHDVCTQACLSMPRVSLVNVVRDRRPPPTLLPGQPTHCVYADNWICIAVSKQDARKSFEDFKEACDNRDLLLHDLHCAEDELEVLGAVFKCRERLIMQKPRRIWRLHLVATRLCSMHRVRGSLLQLWVGHAVHALSLFRPGLSILQAVYRFIADNGDSYGVLPAAAKQEIKLVGAVAFLTIVRLDAAPCPLVFMGDASSSGFAFMQTEASLAEVRCEIRFRERWRFISAHAEDILPLCEQHEHLVDLACGGTGVDGYDGDQKHEGLLFEPAVCAEHASFQSASCSTSYREWLDSVCPHGAAVLCDAELAKITRSSLALADARKLVLDWSAAQHGVDGKSVLDVLGTDLGFVGACQRKGLNGLLLRDLCSGARCHEHSGVQSALLSLARCGRAWYWHFAVPNNF